MRKFATSLLGEGALTFVSLDVGIKTKQNCDPFCLVTVVGDPKEERKIHTSVLKVALPSAVTQRVDTRLAC